MLKFKTQKPEDCILSIDAGTQSVRAVIFDLNGNIREIVKTPIEPYYSIQPGWAEQDPEYFWKMLCVTCRKLFSIRRVNRDSIRGATITSQRDTMINLDKNGKPLRPAIVWYDQRRARNNSKWPPFYLKIILKALNLMEAVNYSITECEANWIMQNQPEIWEKTFKFLFLSGYLTYKLTDEFIDSTANQVGFVPFDFKTQTWAKSSHNYWKRILIDKDKLTELVKPAGILGYITKRASNETGIPEGLPLIAAAPDKACEVLGSGCLTPEIACLSFGTTATVETTNSKYIEVVPFIPPFPSAVPGAYNTEVMIYRGFWLVSWFKREFGQDEVRIARKKKITPEQLFDRMIKDIPPGSMGLTLQPFWSPGIKVPGPEAKGAIIGFGDVHTRAHLYRSILEGLVYGLKEGTERTQKRNKVKIERVRVSGGGSQSDEAMQITADIFNLPTEKPHTFETSALGAAIDAAVGLGFYPNFESAVKGMTRLSDTFHPEPRNRDIYAELYQNVYLKMYDRLKPLYESIRSITGYPPER